MTVWKDKRIWPAAIFLLAILAFVYLKSTRPEQSVIASEERVWYVDTLTVELRSLSPSLTLYGQVETPQLMKAAAPRQAQVEQLLASEGSHITQGQLLLRLDQRDFVPIVVQREAQVAELEAMISSEKLRYASDRKAAKHEKSLLKLSQAAVERAEKMKSKNLGSAAALDQAHQELERQNLSFNERKLSLNDHQARLQQLQARLKKAQADLALAQLDLDRSQVHAPFDGYISQVDVAAGDRVNANQVLLSMYPADTLEVRALIPSPFQAELQPAVSGTSRLTASARHAGREIALVLDRLSGAATSRGIDALFRVTNGVELLRVGNSLSLYLSRPRRDNAVALPYTALYGKDQLYLLEQGRMRGIHVDHLGDYVDPSGKIRLLVSSPQLSAGDQVITTHLPNAVSGLRVEARISKELNNSAKVAKELGQSDVPATE